MGGMRMFRVLVGAVLICALAAFLPMAWMGAQIIKASYLEYAVRDTTANANLLRLVIGESQGGADSLATILRKAGTPGSMRYTVLDRAGKVLADSEETPERMENHLSRPEIMEAVDGRVGVDFRASPTLGSEWMYVAVPFGDDMVIRAATSMDDIDLRLSQWWRKVYAGLILSFGLLLVLAWGMARWLAGPVETAAEGADRFADGDLSYRLPSAGTTEMRKLTASLNSMAAELGERFHQIIRQGEEMRAVFGNMQEGVLAVDNDHRVILSNPAAETLLHIDAASIGQEVEKALRNPDILRLLHDAEESNEPIQREIRAETENGEDILLQARSVKMVENGDAFGVLTVFRDVTRLRLLETMRKDFVANVSHELRTPITTIQSCLETLAEDGGDPEERAMFVEMALKNTRRMGSIITNLLLLAGMESRAENETRRAAVMAVRPVVDEAVAVCSDLAAGRNTTIAVSCESGLSAYMNDRMVIHALVNLIDNAVKYGPENGRISITAEADGGMVRITITDQGPGIPHRLHSRVFERFYRVDGLSRQKEGSGLGLALVKHIAMSHGGDIHLESEIGSGSSFSLVLPRSEPQDC